MIGVCILMNDARFLSISLSTSCKVFAWLESVFAGYDTSRVIVLHNPIYKVSKVSQVARQFFLLIVPSILNCVALRMPLAVVCFI